MSEAKAAAKETELTEQFKNPAIADGNDGTAEGRDVFVEEKKDCCRQTRILLKKNFLMQKRNKTASGAQALVGVAFIIILLIMDAAVKSNNANNKWYIEDTDPKPIEASELTRCYLGPGFDTCYSMGVYGETALEIGGRCADCGQATGFDIHPRLNLV